MIFKKRSKSNTHNNSSNWLTQPKMRYVKYFSHSHWMFRRINISNDNICSAHRCVLYYCVCFSFLSLSLSISIFLSFDFFSKQNKKKKIITKANLRVLCFVGCWRVPFSQLCAKWDYHVFDSILRWTEIKQDLDFEYMRWNSIWLINSNRSVIRRWFPLARKTSFFFCHLTAAAQSMWPLANDTLLATCCAHSALLIFVASNRKEGWQREG